MLILYYHKFSHQNAFLLESSPYVVSMFLRMFSSIEVRFSRNRFLDNFLNLVYLSCITI